jgi:hypothetical protein
MTPIADPAWLVLSHTAISLVAIVAGLVVVFGLETNRRLDGWTAVFLATTVITGASGYLFHRTQILPSQIVGAILLALLAAAIVARYVFALTGAWRWIYVVAAVLSVYLNVFVLIVQSFLKVPALHELAPKGSEPPFAVAQGLTLLIFVALTILAVRRFHPETAKA